MNGSDVTPGPAPQSEHATLDGTPRSSRWFTCILAVILQIVKCP